MDEQWPAEWLRGVLELCVLGVLDREESYGYVIAQRLESAGLGTVKGGTLYPLLGRLEREGLVAATWRAGDGGPGRKYVAITEHGRAELALRAQLWDRFVAGTHRLLPATADLLPATADQLPATADQRATADLPTLPDLPPRRIGASP